MAILLPALVLASCDEGEPNCSCTMRECPEVLEVTILRADGSLLSPGEYRLIADIDGETWEGTWIVTESSSSSGDREIFFSVGLDVGTLSVSTTDGFDQRLLREADEIELTVSMGDVELYRETRALEHSEEVCNECVGDSKCEDDMYIDTAPITIQLS